MAGKIGYFLFVLLVLTTGTLCRQQFSSRPVSDRDFIGSVTQHVPPQEKDGMRYFHHSFIAPEIVSEVLTPVLHLSYKQLSATTPSPQPTEKDFFLSCNHPANPHPDAVNYYVFSLEKIRI